MLARSLVPFAAFVAVVAFVPSVAFAEGPTITSWVVGGFPIIPGTSGPGIQTAARALDTPFVRIFINSANAVAPSATADFSALGGGVVNASGVSGSEPYWFYDVSFSVSPGVPDGTKDILLTATDAGGISTSTTAHVTVDNAPPHSTLAVTLSTTSPNEGDTMYLSGHIDGTGSKGRVRYVSIKLTDAAGAPVVSTEFGSSSFYYDERILAAAVAEGGTFTNVPYTFITFGDRNWFPRAAYLSVSLESYDEAGNFGSTTVTLPINSATTPPPTAHSSVLFLPGAEASRLYYRDALGLEHQVWEPDKFTDIPYLAMNADGSSKYPLYTKDIIGTLEEHNPLESEIAPIFGANLEVYKGLMRYMDGLVADGTIREWQSYPYDWRYDVRDIVQNGTDTKLADGSIRGVYLINTLREMASSSPTGKVTIVGHSSGGLLAKALAIALGTQAGHYIDRIILVGTPQWGTPATAGVMLHADNFAGVSSLLINSQTARSVEQGMPGAYDVLPAASYFAHVADPVATFDAAGALSGRFAASYGPTLASAPALTAYLEDTAGLDASAGTGLRAPVPLRADLIDKAAATHAALDAWTPPADIAVTTIAGWGQDTVKALAYTTGSKTSCALLCTSVPQLQHVPITTQDGDDSVVSPSAIGEVGDRVYFNAARFRDDGHGSFTHQNLTSASVIQNLLKNLLTSSEIDLAPYIGPTEPKNGTNPIIRISSHSPVNLVVTDADGSKSGVVPIPGSDFSGTLEDIPGSAVHVLDDEEYVSVPQAGSYQVSATGYGTGSATLTVERVAEDGFVTPVATYTNLPTSPSSTATFTVADGSSAPPAVDVDGDGAVDVTGVPVSPTLGAPEYLAYMQQVLGALALDAKVGKQLDLKLANIAHLIKKDQKWEKDDDDGPDDSLKGAKLDARILRKEGKLEDYVIKQEQLAVKAKKGNAQPGISPADAEIILDMIAVLKTLAP